MNAVLVLLLLFLLLSCFTLLFLLWQRVKHLFEEQKLLKEQLSEVKKKKQEEEADVRKEEIRHHLHMTALEIRDTVYKQTKSAHPKAIEETPLSSTYHFSDLQELFGDARASQIEAFFDAYKTYVKTYWRASNGGIKKVFRGSAHEPYHEFAHIQHASQNLLRELDQLLVHFQ